MKISLNENKKEIKDDFKLLKLINKDSKKYKAFNNYGYWKKIRIINLNSLRKFGLNNFRGMYNPSITSYGDNQCTDVRFGLNFGILKLLKWIINNLYPINKVFKDQVILGESFYINYIKSKAKLIEKDQKVIRLINKYDLKIDTLRGGCHTFSKFKDKKISHFYIEKLNTIDYIAKKINLNSKKSLLEIGGGFGVFTHLAIELFNIKKIIFIEISPTLYVASQYLKSFYGDSVIDYSKTRLKNKISFSNNNKIEIFCILPHQINYVQTEVDLFFNSHSFCVMEEKIIKEYILRIKRILSKRGDIILVENPSNMIKTDFKFSKINDLFTSDYKIRNYKKATLHERDLPDEYLFISKLLK